MTTPEIPTESSRPPARDLTVLNLGIALITVLLMSALVSLVFQTRSEGLGKTALVFPLLVILLAVGTATISAWHSGIPSSQESMKKAIGLTSWILTFVTLGFGFLALILTLIVIFRL